MRADQIEEVAADAAGAMVAEVLRVAGVRLPANMTPLLAGIARDRIRKGIAKATAVRIEAGTVAVADLRTR